MHRIHARFKLTVVPTGRLAASNPNVLAVPKHSRWGQRIRQSIVPPRGYQFGSWDYDQLEMRILAHESQDPDLLRVFRLGQDIHALTASRLFGVPNDRKRQDDTLHRLPAKTTGFGIVMGISGYGLWQQLTKALRTIERDAKRDHRPIPKLPSWSPDDCDRFIEEWLDTFPGVRAYQEAKKQDVLDRGWTTDLVGRRFLLYHVWSANEKLADHALRQAHALPIQAGAQKVVKQAMARIPYLLDHAPREAVFPLLQVHDELDFEVLRTFVRTWHTQIVRVMTETTKLSVPLKVKGSVGPSWGELKEL